MQYINSFFNLFGSVSSVSDWSDWDDNEKSAEKTQPSLSVQVAQTTLPTTNQIAQPILNPSPEIKAPNCSSWTPRELSWEMSIKKMHKNAEKAIKEHREDAQYKDDHSFTTDENTELAAYATLKEALPPIESLHEAKEKPLTFSYDVCAEQSRRPTMEDAHFYLEFDQGVVAGILDGHGGSEVANYASKEFEKNFPSCLEKFKGNIHQAFEYLIDEIHQKIAKNLSWNEQGTTAVISFINKNTRFVYTATLADSEANIYRSFGNRVKSIPLSTIRNWASQKDSTRAAIANKLPIILENWPQYKGEQTKSLRVNGANVSRSIGDLSKTTLNDYPAIIHKPKITVNQLQPGDILIFACDGLKDFVSEKEIVDLIQKQQHPINNLSQSLVKASLYKQGRSMHSDNVSVLAIQVS